MKFEHEKKLPTWRERYNKIIDSGVTHSAFAKHCGIHRIQIKDTINALDDIIAEDKKKSMTLRIYKQIELALKYFERKI